MSSSGSSSVSVRGIFAVLLGTVVLFTPACVLAVPQYTVRDLGSFKPTAINDLGQVVGYNDDSNDHDTYFFDGTKLVDVTNTYGTNGAPWGLNNLGQIVGWNFDATKENAIGHAYILGTIGGGVVGSAKPLADLGAWSTALAINDQGQAVGGVTTSLVETDPWFPVVFNGTTVTQLSPLAGMAHGINRAGEIVGEVASGSIGTGPQHAFLYSGGTLTDLGTLANASSSAASGINNNGQIVGNSGGDVFLYQNEKMSDLGHVVRNGQVQPTYAYWINDAGIVAGHYGLSTPFVYQNGQFKDLSALVGPIPGVLQWETVNGINNAGQLIAVANVSSFPVSHLDAFLLTPVPEPSMLAWIAGAGALLLVPRRRCGRYGSENDAKRER